MVTREINLSKILGKNSSVLMLGPRGVGKTRLARTYVREHPSAISIDLLRSDNFNRYLKDPSLLRKEIDAQFRNQERLLVFIDEIQKIPLLLDEIHAAIEDYKGKIQFVLTGSSARKLKRGGANLLAGRAIGVKLHPLTSREIEIDLLKVLRFGSLPGILIDNESPELTLKTYVETYLREEIMQEALVRRVDAFARFLDLAGQFHGEPTDASALAKSAGVSSNTIAEYFQILEDTLLGFRLPGFSASVKKQLRVTPRFYLFDNGVANAIRGEVAVEFTPRTSRWGKLFEAWIIQEAFRLNDYANLNLKFFYWRTNTDQEVDLVVSRGLSQPLAAIEIKSQEAPEAKDYRGLEKFASEFPDTPLYCFCTTPRAYQDGRIKILPWQEGLGLLQRL